MSIYESDRTDLPQSLRRFWRSNSRALIIVAVLILLVIVTAQIEPSFGTPDNLLSVARQTSLTMVLSIGQTFAIMVGGIDLSVGAIVKLVGVFSAGIINGQEGMIIPVVVGCLLVGMVIGLVHGLIVSKLGVDPFIVTLGTLSILRGIALGYTNTPVGRIPPSMQDWVYSELGPIPVPLIAVVLLVALAWVLLRKTLFGKYVRAVGGDPQVARLSGINVDRITILVYMLSATLAALGGLYMASRMGVGDPVVGDGLEIDSITAAVLGGAVLGGGSGSILGTVAGVLILGVINNMLNLLQVSSFYRQVVKGAIILLAVSIYKGRRQ